jgi:hypothetical protein
MNFSDELLGAYVDGELDCASRQQVDAAIASQPEVAQRVAQLKQTRERLRSALDPTLTESVPDGLLAVLDAAPAEPSRATDFAKARRTKHRAGTRSGSSWPVWTAIAASAALAAIISFALLRHGGRDELLIQQDNELLAGGALAEALSTRLANAQSGDATVRVGLSFRAKSGRYCRTFTLAEEMKAGIACREPGAWHVRALAPTEGMSGLGAQQAGSAMPPALVAIVQNQIEGEPLDAAAEADAMKKNWGAAQ